MKIQHFFDPDTSTLTYIASCPESNQAVIIDPVLNYDGRKHALETRSVDELQAYLTREGLSPKLVLETHVHADHLSGAFELKKRYPQLQIGISYRIKEVKNLFLNSLEIINNEDSFDLYLEGHEDISIGSISIKTLETPGHTPACMSFALNGHSIFTGDSLFMPDSGTGRCDFPGGNPVALFSSVKNLLYKQDQKAVFYTGHDYQPGGRELKFCASLSEHLEKNIHINKDTSQDEFVKMRTERDKTLPPPNLLWQSLQFNVLAGRPALPGKKENNAFLKIPLDLSKTHLGS